MHLGMFDLGICRESQITQDGDITLLNEEEKAQIFEWATEISLYEPNVAPALAVEPLTERLLGRPGPVTQYLGNLVAENPAVLRADRVRRALQLEVVKTGGKVKSFIENFYKSFVLAIHRMLEREFLPRPERNVLISLISPCFLFQIANCHQYLFLF